MNKEQFRTTLTRCFSDLEHWVEANEMSYDPVAKHKSDIVRVQLHNAEHALKYLLKTSIDNMG